MHDAILTELKTLLTILAQCLASFQTDCSEAQPSQNLTEKIIASIIFKIQKLAECARAIQKICKSLKKENLACLPCLQSSQESPKEGNNDYHEH